VQVTVIGNGQSRLLELLGSPDQVVDPVRAVEERVLGMAVEMDEGHLGKVSRGTPTRQSKTGPLEIS
jgi:hypothetical protein